MGSKYRCRDRDQHSIEDADHHTSRESKHLTNDPPVRAWVQGLSRTIGRSFHRDQLTQEFTVQESVECQEWL